MADGGHGLVGVKEVAHGSTHVFIAAQIFGAAPAGDDQSVVIGNLHISKRGVEREVVAGLFAIGLRTFKVMNGGLDLVARFFVGADGVYRVAHSQQRLEGNHGFIVLAVVAADHQNFLASHVCLLVFRVGCRPLWAVGGCSGC